jgi:hypothetical protein
MTTVGADGLDKMPEIDTMPNIDTVPRIRHVEADGGEDR